MALVMLPCDLPWWSSIHKRLTALQEATELEPMLENMQKIHDLCNVSLDPDDDKRIDTVFDGLRTFVLDHMSLAEREHFQTFTLKNIAKRALTLKAHRPPRGLEFSLQQQTDAVEISYELIAALLANAVFSTFPKRTDKTHPTLQDFNFTNFFMALHLDTQQAKFRSILKYFDWIELDDNLSGCLKVSRQVMTGKQWLTIEDWLECGLPLCSLNIRHEGKMEKSKSNEVQTVFVSPRLGGNVLRSGESQECLHLSIFPEVLPILLYVEALEDNESLLVEDARQIGRIIDPNNKSVFETMTEPNKISLLLMDAENYTNYPINQFEEDNVLRELNKCLLAFQQKTSCSILENRNKRNKDNSATGSKRFGLSPIGESGCNTPGDVSTTIVIRQASTSTKRSSYDSEQLRNDIASRRAWLAPNGCNGTTTADATVPTNVLLSDNNNTTTRRGRFIVLGSSGECLPVTRKLLLQHDSSSLYSSCESELYLSARGSFDEADDDDSDNDNFAKKYCKELDTPEKRSTFAEKLRAALRQSDHQHQPYSSASTDSSYAVDISISGSRTDDDGIRIRRGGSRGFVLTEEDEDFDVGPMTQEQRWLNRFQRKQNGSSSSPHKNDSSSYSFSTDYSSELEEVYEQFAKWLDSDPPISDNGNNKLDARDEAMLSFANSLLKRTLSESYVGVPLTEGCMTSSGDEKASEDFENKKNRMILGSRSWSLELSKQKHRIAAQLKHKLDSSMNPPKIPLKSNSKRLKWSIDPVQSQQTINCEEITLKLQLTQQKQTAQQRHGKENVHPVATGNWGCGKSTNGDVQLKLVIQWMAASVAGVPELLYYTAGNEKLTKLDTVCRVLLDRNWTVGELASATLAHAKDILESAAEHPVRRQECFFEKLIGLY